jgi:hypothetical protein
MVRTLFAIVLLFPLSGIAAVTVTFVEPEKYVDTGWVRTDSASVLKGIEAHLVALGKGLPPGHKLAIEVLDIDLAGEERMRRGTQDIRVQRGGADWPSMRLRYTLERDGQKETREETIADMNYLHRRRDFSNDALAYEKRMLDDWFRARFAPPAKAAAR